MVRLQNIPKLCKKEFKEAEVDYINTIIQDRLDNKNTKPFWKYIKSKRQDNIGTPQVKKNGSLVNEMMEWVNQTFLWTNSNQFSPKLLVETYHQWLVHANPIYHL